MFRTESEQELSTAFNVRQPLLSTTCILAVTLCRSSTQFIPWTPNFLNLLA